MTVFFEQLSLKFHKKSVAGGERRKREREKGGDMHTMKTKVAIGTACPCPVM